MKITVEYVAQARSAAGTSREIVDVDAGATVADVLKQRAEAHGDPLRSILFDGSGAIQPTLLLFVSDAQVDRDGTTQLSDGDSLTVMTPISGG